ncbi:MlaD family protein [Nocardia sp. BMG51109]|uniref:MlaD family protein n=1 Tax=Nocardia sp. BMG51109 TaxID=1056816 RepID=UPI0004665AD0|nr:MlaD family protein [Nocardia sp. BMG51109]
MTPRSVASSAAILAIAVIGSAYLAFGVANVDWLRQTMSVTMAIPESGGLMTHSKVLLSGVQVGEVVSVTHAEQAVRIGLRIDAGYRVPAASPARIEALSGLGEPYLDFRPTSGDGPYLRDGQSVRADRVVTPLSIPEVAKTTTELLRQLDPAALTSIVDTFDQATDGTEAIVPPLSRATDLLAATLLSRTVVLREMLTAAQAHAHDMGWTEPALRRAAQPWADFGPALSDVAAAVGRFARIGTVPDDYLVDNENTLGALPLLREIAEIMKKTGPQTESMIPMLRPVLESATRAVGTLDLSSLITQALQTVDPDGALRLQISVK